MNRTQINVLIDTVAFVASRLSHDADAIVAGLAPEPRQITRPLPPVFSQPFSGHYFANDIVLSQGSFRGSPHDPELMLSAWGRVSGPAW